MIKKLITVQHCQSQQHVNGMMGGATDWPLTDLGLQQARKIAEALSEMLKTENPYALYSSDLKRAQQTAEIIAQGLNITPIYSSLLREQDFGDATGKSKEWFRANSYHKPDELPLVYHKFFKNAESGEDVYHRVEKAIADMEASGEENVIVVGHGGSLQMLTAAWLKLPLTILEHTALIGAAGGVSFMTLRGDGVRVLNRWNNLSYIQPK